MGFLLSAVLILMSIVVHEVAHAWQARREGDFTAEQLGRITLNPLPHIDPIGSVVVPLLLFYSGSSVMFGWAKPVPVDSRNFRNLKWGDIRVSMAGIVSNILLAVLFTLLASAAVAVGGGGLFDSRLATVFRYGVAINLFLAFFNLIPIPPLDGSHVLYRLLPPRAAARYQVLGRWGFLLVLALAFFFQDVLTLLLTPATLLMGAADWFIRLWI